MLIIICQNHNDKNYTYKEMIDFQDNYNKRSKIYTSEKIKNIWNEYRSIRL